MSDAEQRRREWQRIVGELRAFRRERDEAWGGVDDVAVARYVAGSASPDERAAIELAASRSPVVEDALRILEETFAAPGLVAAPTAPEPASLWSRARDGALELSERLVAAIDDAGRSIARTMDAYARRPELVLGHMGGGVDAGQRWELPVPDSTAHVVVETRSAREGTRWELSFRVLADDGAEVEPELELVGPEGRRLFSGPLSLQGDEPFLVKPGACACTLRFGEHVVRFTVDVGGEEAT